MAVKTKIILSFLFVGICTFPFSPFLSKTMAQSVLQINENGGKREMVPLNGTAEVVFVSKSKHLIIESSRPSLDISHDPQKNKDGEWEYVFQLQLRTREGITNERTFSITEKGTTDMVNVHKRVYIANNRYVYNVIRNENTIFLVDNTQTNDAHLVNGEAAIEIHSTFDIQIQTPTWLPCRVDKSKTKAGVHCATVILNMVQYGQIKSNAVRNRRMYDQYNELLITRAEAGGNVSNSEWDSLSRWQEEVENEEAKLLELSTISLSKKGSNTLTIDVSNIVAKQKWVFVVKGSDEVSDTKKNNPQRWFFLTNYSFSPLPQHSYGLTVGRVGRIGWYASFLTNGNFKLSTESAVNDYTSTAYLWSGEKSTSRFSVCGGGAISLWNLGYFYAGLGYGIRNLAWYTISGELVSIETGSFEGLLIDAGLVVKTSEHILLSVGFGMQIPKTYYEIKMGVGYRF